MSALGGSTADGDAATLDWKTGEIYSDAQNMARMLMETPANKLTATLFAEHVQTAFKGIAGITVNVCDEGEHFVRPSDPVD